MSTKFINANTVQQSRMSFIFSTDRIQQVSKFHILQSASVLTRHWRWIATTSDDPLLTAGSMSVPPQHKRSHWVGWCRQQTEFRTVCTVLGPTESQICNTAPLILHYKHNTHSLTHCYLQTYSKQKKQWTTTTTTVLQRFFQTTLSGSANDQTSSSILSAQSLYRKNWIARIQNDRDILTHTIKETVNTSKN